MSCRGCLECLLKLLNFLLALVGLAMIVYGVYMFIEFRHDSNYGSLSPTSEDHFPATLFSRPMFLDISADEIFEKLPKAWFIYLFISTGCAFLIISCFGCIGATVHSGCCLGCYSALILLLLISELGFAAFLFFDKRWEDELPPDKTGYFGMVYHFLKRHWNVAKWVALGTVVLEALAFLLALVVRAANMPDDFDSDDEFIFSRQDVRKPLLSRQPTQSASAPVTPTFDQHATRNDAWSTRMREKYGLNAAEFTYSPESNRVQQTTPPAEEKSRCTVM